MNKPVNFEIAKLLKEKSWNKETLCHYFEDGAFRQNELKDTVGMDYGSDYIVEFSELIHDWNDGFLMKKNGDRCFGCNKNKGYFETFSAPTIAEVVCWIYSKYQIWIQVSILKDDEWHYSIRRKDNNWNIEFPTKEKYTSIENAYEKGINVVLNTYKPKS